MAASRLLIPGIVLALCAGVAAHADTPAGTAPPAATAPQWHGGHRHGGMRHVLAQLDLTQDQQAQVRSILAQAKPQFRALMADRRANHDALASTAPTDHPAYDSLLADAKTNAARSVQLRSDVWAQIHAILTPAQQAKIPGIVAADVAARDARRAARQSQHGST